MSGRELGGESLVQAMPGWRCRWANPDNGTGTWPLAVRNVAPVTAGGASVCSAMARSLPC